MSVPHHRRFAFGQPGPRPVSPQDRRRLRELVRPISATNIDHTPNNDEDDLFDQDLQSLDSNDGRILDERLQRPMDPAPDANGNDQADESNSSPDDAAIPSARPRLKKKQALRNLLRQSRLNRLRKRANLDATDSVDPHGALHGIASGQTTPIPPTTGFYPGVYPYGPWHPPYGLMYHGQPTSGQPNQAYPSPLPMYLPPYAHPLWSSYFAPPPPNGSTGNGQSFGDVSMIQRKPPSPGTSPAHDGGTINNQSQHPSNAKTIGTSHQIRVVAGIPDATYEPSLERVKDEDVPKFSGEGTTSFIAWHRVFERFAFARNWSVRTCFRQLVMRLSGDAHRYWDRQPNKELLTYQDALDLLTARYLDESHQQAALTKLGLITQRATETVVEYGRRFLGHYEDSGIQCREDELKKLFIEGLNDQVRQYASAHVALGVPDMIKALSATEVVFGTSKPAKPVLFVNRQNSGYNSNSISRPSRPRFSSPTCWNCNRRGHRQSECRAPVNPNANRGFNHSVSNGQPQQQTQVITPVVQAPAPAPIVPPPSNPGPTQENREAPQQPPKHTY